MYSSASSRVRVGSALSPDFAVRRGVAQGCPLCPLLYAIFVDPVLRDRLVVGGTGCHSAEVGGPGIRG